MIFTGTQQKRRAFRSFATLRHAPKLPMCNAWCLLRIERSESDFTISLIERAVSNAKFLGKEKFVSVSVSDNEVLLWACLGTVRHFHVLRTNFRSSPYNYRNCVRKRARILYSPTDYRTVTLVMGWKTGTRRFCAWPPVQSECTLPTYFRIRSTKMYEVF